MKEVCERIETTRSKPVIFLVISFLIVMLIYSSSSSRFVQAVPVFGPAGEKKCTTDFSTFLPTRSCCWIDTDTDTEAYKKFCEVCTYQPDGTYGDCKTTEGPVAFAPKPPTTIPPSAEQPLSPPPSNALPPPSTSQQQTTTCHDGSTPDANGNCPPPSHKQIESTNNNNPPSDHHKSKLSGDSGSNSNK